MLGLVACQKSPDFPNNPIIEFNEINKDVLFDSDLQVVVDSITISINFEDGDGDLGVELSDLGNVAYRAFSDTSISSTGEVTYTFVNYYVDMFRKDNGEYIKVDPFIRFGGSFEPLVDYDQVGPIEGVLNYGFKISLQSASQLDINENDTAKFEVYIVDRNLNVSNKITTEEIILFEKE